MNYKKAKIYYDGSHYVAIKPNLKSPYGRRKPGRKKTARIKPTEIGGETAIQQTAQQTATQQTTVPQSGKQQTGAQQATQKQSATPTISQRFERAYKESLSRPKKERKAYVKAALKDGFESEERLNAYVLRNTERMKTNAMRRRIRLMRKMQWQDWDYFCTFTYADNLHTEETFKKRLQNTLKHCVARKGWKYIGVWERSPENNRLHFHGIFRIPQLIGELERVKDYNTKKGRMQVTYCNSHFLKYFGRNDFKKISSKYEAEDAIKYVAKYMEKSGERLVYGGKLPTYVISDIMDEDVVTEYDNRIKLLLFDNFTCINNGEILGPVSKETLALLPKCN